MFFFVFSFFILFEDTSLTNFFAFLLGSQSSLPAVEYFCLYACTAILFDFLLQVKERERDEEERRQGNLH